MYLHEPSTALFHMGDMRSCEPKTATICLKVTVCVIDLFLAFHLVFLGSTMIRTLFILCLGKTWSADTIVFVDDYVFDDFSGAQVLPLNLMGIGNGLRSKSKTLCKWHNTDFTDPHSQY